MMLPNAIDEYASGERILVTGDVASELQSPASVLECLASGACQQYGALPGDLVTLTPRLTTDKYMGRGRLRFVSQYHGTMIRHRLCSADRVDCRLQTCPLIQLLLGCVAAGSFVVHLCWRIEIRKVPEQLPDFG